MATIREVEENFRFWINYSRGNNIEFEIRQEVLELMEKVLEEFAKEKGVSSPLDLKGMVSDDDVLGNKSQAAFENFLDFISKYRSN